MNLFLIHRIALKALSQNMLRTGLTMLGIIIGVGAVICVVAIGEGASARVEQAIANIGANMIWVEAGGINRGGVRTGAFGTKTLTLEDYDAIKAHVPLVTNVTPQADTRVQVVYGNQNWGTSVRGVGPEYLALKDWKIVNGGMYTEADVERASNVCVLGQTLVDQLFGSQDPIGESIRVKDQPCAVVGVLDVKGQSTTGQDQDDNLLMPYTTVMKKIKGQTWLDDIMCSAVSAKVVDQAELDIAAIVRERHHIKPGADDDFNLRHPTEIAEAVKQSTQIMEALLGKVGIPRSLRDFQARWESRGYDVSTSRLFHSPWRRYFCCALRHPFGRVASQQVRPVGEAESSIQVLMHRDLAARQRGSPAHGCDLQAQILKADRVVTIHGPLELEREHPIEIASTTGQKSIPPLRRRDLKSPVERGDIVFA